MSAATKIKCEIDGTEHYYLPDYLAEKHGLTVEEYQAKFPNAPLISDAVEAAHEEASTRKRRQHPPKVTELTMEFGGIEFQVNTNVPADACLPLPPHYRLPRHGTLAKDINRALRYYAAGRSTWIWGPPGTGKDALPHALCASTRTPSEIFQISQEVDIMAWFFEKDFDKDGTVWTEGILLKMLRDGYTCPDGTVLPYTIILSDFDRAGRSQAEAIRLVTDSIQGRIKGPNGQTYLVRHGTRVIITANTMGAGDASGRCISANVVDSSIINRIQRKVRFHGMDWRDEEPIIRAKYPLFAETAGHLLSHVGNATAALRKAIDDGDLYGEFSHRDLETWIGDCEDILRFSKKAPKDLLKQGFLSYADGLPDEDNKLAAMTLVDPYFKGGALERGDTSHIEDDELDAY
jgi:hypothetical protein